jgi:hypothetical protein
MLDKLPFILHINIIDQVYTGPVSLVFEFDQLNDDNVKPFFSSANIWSRAANAQFFSAGNESTKVDLTSIDPSQERNSLTLHLSVNHVESAAWVSLLCQLSQVAYHSTALRSITIRLDTLPLEHADYWIEPAMQALFNTTHMPSAFEAVEEFLYPGKPIMVEVDFERDLSSEEFDEMEKELEIWGCLLATGGVRVDLSIVEEPLHALSFGTTTQLTPSWIRYSKDEFDGPVEAVALLDHWVGGLIRKGIPIVSLEIS